MAEYDKRYIGSNYTAQILIDFSYKYMLSIVRYSLHIELCLLTIHGELIKGSGISMQVGEVCIYLI